MARPPGFAPLGYADQAWVEDRRDLSTDESDAQKANRLIRKMMKLWDGVAAAGTWGYGDQRNGFIHTHGHLKRCIGWLQRAT
jgi:hypothetical protein